jgi:hypothetical protein
VWACGRVGEWACGRAGVPAKGRNGEARSAGKNLAWAESARPRYQQKKERLALKAR